MKICLDAGHGGKDPGAVNGSYKEKEIALNITLKLAEILKDNGIDVFLTRTGDLYDSVNEKARKANNSNADFFISIHCNSAVSATANGTECLIYGYDGESDTLAVEIQKSVVQALNMSDRGIKERKDLAVLNSTKMPAVLVETAFISNNIDKGKLVNMPEAFASAIAEGILKYLKIGGLEMEEESKIIIDEKELAVSRILKNGTNYIKLRDIAEALGYDISNKGNIAVLNKKA